MRDIKIDFLRFLGLSLIILAHVAPPRWLLQLRNFDVPLMVVVSGLAFIQSSKIEPYQIYLWKRIKRLLFPVWLFLSFYFLVNFGLAQLGTTVFPSTKNILDSYLLTDEVDYVWVIRVFLLVALTAPFISSVNRKIKDNRVYFLILTIAYLAYELFLSLTLPYTNHFWEKWLAPFLYYGIAFSLVFAVGLRIPQLSKKQCLILAGFFLSIFFALGIGYFANQGKIVFTQTYKYPPSAYYLSYALGMTLLAWLAADKAVAVINKNRKLETLLLFVAQNSLWIYLWHIPIVDFFESYRNFNFASKYFLVYLATTLITFLQVSVVKNMLLPAIGKESWKKNIKVLLTG